MGQLLIAGAGIFGAEFRQAMVLLVDHDESNALGFVLNRPSPMSGPEAAEALRALSLPDDRLYFGGPVQPGAVAILGEFDGPESAGSFVFDSIGMVAPRSDGFATEGLTRAKLFAGYAGWGPGQLEGELEEGSWIVEDARAEDVFTTDPDNLWKNVLRRKGGEFVMLSTMSPDPSAN